jgi:hypothetical protein
MPKKKPSVMFFTVTMLFPFRRTGGLTVVEPITARCLPIYEASSIRQGDGQRFKKKAMKTTNQKNEAPAPANVRPSSVSKTSNAQPDFVRHCTNRRLATEAVLNYL